MFTVRDWDLVCKASKRDWSVKLAQRKTCRQMMQRYFLKCVQNFTNATDDNVKSYSEASTQTDLDKIESKVELKREHSIEQATCLKNCYRYTGVKTRLIVQLFRTQDKRASLLERKQGHITEEEVKEKRRH